MKASSDDRLTMLEVRNAEQERTIEELSAQVAAQWGVIDRLDKAIGTLAHRFAALEDQSTPRHEAGRPPHW